MVQTPVLGGFQSNGKEISFFPMPICASAACFLLVYKRKHMATEELLKQMQNQILASESRIRQHLATVFQDSPAAFACAISEVELCKSSLEFISGLLGEHELTTPHEFVNVFVSWSITRGKHWQTMVKVKN